MSFEADIIAKYAAIFDGQLYWDTTPDGWNPADLVGPFCVVNSVGGEELRYVDNTPHEFLNARLQFSIWGARRMDVSDAARLLANTVAATSAADFITIPMGAAVGDYDEQLVLRGSRQDFGFWYKNQ